MRQNLGLRSIRSTLALMEDSIIFNLFRRSTYRLNSRIYLPGGIHISGFKGSFLDYLMLGRERLDGSVGRYDDRREHPFFRPRFRKIAKRRIENQEVAPASVNENEEIKRMYLSSLDKICLPGDDNEYGSCALIDIACLQDLSLRVHLGEFVAESKVRSDKKLRTLAEHGEWDQVEDALKNRRVEEEIRKRVTEKSKRYGLNPEFIEDFYLNKVIPLTLSVEVEYLKKRSL